MLSILSELLLYSAAISLSNIYTHTYIYIRFTALLSLKKKLRYVPNLLPDMARIWGQPSMHDFSAPTSESNTGFFFLRKLCF